jgi:RNA polymerase sigma-70 factor, ECF subfamily
MVAAPWARRAQALWSDEPLASARSSEPEANAQAEHASLRALFERHYDSVARLLRRFGVAHTQLDDAAQEVFWVAARRLTDIQPGKETTFLYGVALRVALNEARRKRAGPPLVDIDELSNLVDEAPSPEEQLGLRQARDLLDAALERLPMELRTVFVLFELEGVPVPEIAELEAIPVGTASSRLRRARQEFAAVVKRIHASLVSRGQR